MNWSSRARFVGFLVMVLNFDGPTGCLGIAKALQIGGLPGSGCTQALAYRDELKSHPFLVHFSD